jgi:inorganic pyrophosphatase/exopolyphosphatase
MFLDEFNKWNDAAYGGRIFLVDHNRLAPPQAAFKSRVIGVIDHHVDEGDYKGDPVFLRTIDMVGSW